MDTRDDIGHEHRFDSLEVDLPLSPGVHRILAGLHGTTDSHFDRGVSGSSETPR